MFLVALLPCAKCLFRWFNEKIVSVLLANGQCECARVASLFMIGFDFLADSPYSLRCSEMAAGSSYRGAWSPASGRDENLFLEYHCDCRF